MLKTKVIDLSALYDASKNPRQWEAHQAGERYVLYGGGYGGGKTAWLINEGIALSIEYPGNRGFLCCKIGADFRDNALKQLEKFLPKELIAAHHKSERFFRLVNGSVIMYGGLGNDIEAVKAISNMPELGWFGVDQAEQITEQQFLLLDGRLRLVLPGIKYKALLTANPEPGWLRDRFIEQDLPDHRFVPALAKDNPYLPKDYEKKLYEMYPEALAERLIEGNWDVDTEGKSFIPYQLIRAAINRRLEPAGDISMGVDVAYTGVDETVCCVRQGGKVLHFEAWGGEDTVYSAGRVARLIRELKPKSTYIENVGVGVGVFDPLKNEGYAVKTVYPSAPAKNDKIYANLRAENYSRLLKRFEKGDISIPDHSKLQAQLSTLTYKYDTKTRLLIMDKQSMRRKGIASPDYADALMLAFIDAPVGEMKPIKTLDFPGTKGVIYARR